MRTRRRRTPRRRPAEWRGTLQLAAVFAALVGINVYVFFVRGGTSIRDVKKALKEARIAPTVTAEPVTASPECAFRDAGEFAAILRRAGMPTAEERALLLALRQTPRAWPLSAGQCVLHLDQGGAVDRLDFSGAKIPAWRAQRGKDGAWTVARK